MRVYLERKENKHECGYHYEDQSPLFELDEVNIYDIFKFNNNHYCVWGTNRAKNYAVVSEIKFDKSGENQSYEQNIKCPYCGYENQDSWECEEQSEKYECGKCGSTFSYERQLTVEYNSVPVKANSVKILK